MKSSYILPLLGCFFLVGSSVINPSQAQSSARPKLPQAAVYRWANSSTNVDAFSQWLGQPVWAEDFIGSESWDNVGWPTWWLEGWSKWVKEKPGRRLILGVPILPGPWDGSGPTGGQKDVKKPVSLEQGAKGEYNHHYKDLAENLVKHGLGDTVLRLGWEFNGGWYTWRAQGKEAAFAEYWRQIVKTMRAVPGTEKLKFCWNPTLGYQQFPAEKAWPGDEFVDYVGLDVYDESWIKDGYPWPKDATPEIIQQRREKVWREALLNGDHGLVFWSRFAAEHKKPFVIPEWGLNNRVDMPEQHGGLDNVHFIEQMHAFMTDPKNNVYFQCYFDVQAPDGHHQISPGADGKEKTEFPNAARRFKELFGR